MKDNKMIRRILSIVLCAIFVLLAGMTSVAAASDDSDTLTVGVPVDRCPLFYIDGKSDEITGIGVDLMKVAAEKAGYSVVFKAITEKTIKDALDNKEYDLIMPFGSAIASAYGSKSIVSDNLLLSPFTLVTSGNRSLPPLSSLHVGMLRSQAGVAESVNQLYPHMQIDLYETMADSVKALRKGEVDGLLHNSYVWSYVLQKPSYKDLSMQPSAVFSMDFRAGTLDTPKGQEIIKRLNGGIASLDDIQRQTIILDHTSRKLYRYDLSDYLYQFGLLILAVGLLIAALVLFAVQRIRAVRRWHEEKMQQMLDHDNLTGLLSMNGFRKRVEELLHKYPDTPYFLSYNNIRNFKYINDSLGREAGDGLLKFWAEKSMKNLSANEEAIGRIDADHFAVLRHITSDEKTNEDLQNVFEPVEYYFIDRGKDYRVQISSGIYVLTPADFRKIDVDHMLDMARVAEKRVRESRTEDHIFYNPEQWEKGKRIAEIINYLPAAIKSGDIQVYYQPQVNYNEDKIIGAEALCRWDHSKLGWLYPFDFISTLEEAGLIFDLDCFVWERVCQDLDRWNKQGQHRSVSVNVSRNDIRDNQDLATHFFELIRKYSLSPDQLHIEITETAYVENHDILINVTEKLRAMGFLVEMDDFGSGYSSLHMLKEVPMDRIKMDLNFLTSSGDIDKCHKIISCMIQMVHLLDMDLIAEGVETKEQADFLKEKGCSEMQGYYFYKPMPVDEFEKLLKK